MNSFSSLSIGWLLVALVPLARESHALDISPLGKVVEMLSELQESLVKEGREEALTYDKFACYCKDMATHKTEDVNIGQDDVDKTTAEIETLTTERNGFDNEIAELNARIDELAKTMKATEDKRAKEHQAYLRLKAELEESAESCHDAGGEIEAQLTHAAALISLPRTVRPLRKALLRAKALEFKSLSREKPAAVSKFLEALIQQDPGMSATPSMETATAAQNEEAGEQLMDAVHGIEGDYAATLDQVTRDEFKGVGTHQIEMQRIQNMKNLAEDDLKKAQERREFRVLDIAENTRDLTKLQAELLDDQQFLKDSTERCNWASSAWDQRTKMRSGELSAVTTALVVVKAQAMGRAGPSPEPFTLLQLQQDETSSPVDRGGRLHRMMHRLRQRHAEADEAAKVSEFVAQQEEQEAGRQETPEALTIALLKQRGGVLKSEELLGLAAKVVGSPFDKVKQLLQELTERLLQEAADEANHKGWCDKEMTRMTRKRDTKVEDIRHLNSRMASAEVKRDELQETIARLEKEIDALTTGLDEAAKERQEESEENMVAVREAEEGMKAVASAEEVLMKFYKTAAKAEMEGPPPEPTNPTPASASASSASSFLQISSRKPHNLHASEDKGAPELGFSGAYVGKQSATASIMGLLQVVQSDFKRAIKESEKSEREAQKTYQSFIQDSQTSIRQKTTVKAAQADELVAVKSTLLEDKSSLVAAQAEMSEALKELSQIKPSCVEEKQSYEQRTQKRQEEIDSLNEALCIFDPSAC